MNSPAAAQLHVCARLQNASMCAQSAHRLQDKQALWLLATPCSTHSCREELPLETVEAMHSALPLGSGAPKLEPEQPRVEPRAEILDRVGAHVLHAVADTLGEVW